ncbi:MAG: hypothetical protein Tsb0020_47340 [Haliangiales bacterium]
MALAIALLALSGGAAWAAPLSGQVFDGQSLEPVVGAEVTIAGTALATRTDETGRFALPDVPAGAVEVVAVADGYEATRETIDHDVAGTDNVTLLLFAPGASSEIIEIESRAPPPPAAPAQQDLRREELTRIPGTRGDALTSLKSLPGVANADAGGSGPGLLVIRGSAPEDSKITIDGIEVPILYHFFGLQSVIPSEFIDTIDYLPGGFGARDGNATGGVIDVTTRSDQMNEYRGFAELSFINLAAFVQGPISEARNLQFAAGLRRSAIDFVLPVVIPEDSGIAFVTSPQYYDGQLRVDWRPSYQHRVSVLGLTSFDLLRLLNDILLPNEDDTVNGRWENETSFTRAIATWQYSGDTIENRLVGSAGVDGFRFDIAGERYLRVQSRSVDVRDDLIYTPSERLRLRAGGELRVIHRDSEIRFPLPPQEGAPPPESFSDLPLIEFDKTYYANTAALYLAADIEPVAGTTVSPGVRLDYFDRIGERTISPRLAVRQALGPWNLHLALGSYSRAPQQAEELQRDLMPELATQYVLGVERDLFPGVSASFSGFYTDRQQLVVQDAVMAAIDPNQAYVNRGVGRSFGGEALIRAKLPGFFGWVAYTLSRSDRVDEPLGDRRLFDFDQTHNLIAVASYTRGPWELGARWQYSTGSPVTPVLGSIYLADTNRYTPVYGEVNSDRLDTAHQLDVRIDRTWRFDSWRLSAYLDVTNVYANPRTLGFRYNFNFTRREAIEELPLVPALGVRGSF